MPRLNNLNDVLFPVEEHPVFVKIKEPFGERQVPVPDKKAIVHGKARRVLSIVSRDYRLVSNREALDWAVECCRTVFPETKPGEWQVTATDAPRTGSHCFIDLAHNSTALDFRFVPAKARPDAFGPFIRVTNSYNRMRALAFDIGFYRKVCSNGMILPESLIQFKFTHVRRDIGETIEWAVDQQKLAAFRAGFDSCLGALQDCRVPRLQFERFVRTVLLLRRPEPWEPKSPRGQQWQELSSHLRKMCDQYVEELGENAYAVFNVVTDFASHPPANRLLGRERHGLQRLAGNWLSDFSQECRKSDFRLDEYLNVKDKADPGSVSA